MHAKGKASSFLPPDFYTFPAVSLPLDVLNIKEPYYHEIPVLVSRAASASEPEPLQRPTDV